MQRKYYYLLVILIGAIPVCAQRYYTSHERPDYLMLHLTASVSKLDYKSQDGHSALSPTTGIGLEYAHFFNYNWGLSIGGEFSSFAGVYSFHGRRDSLSMVDTWSSYGYKLRQVLTTKEYQRVTYISIPLKLQFRERINKLLDLNVSAGMAYTMHYNEKKSIKAGIIHREAFFNDIYVNVDDFPSLMFGNFHDYIHPSSEKQFDKTLLAVGQAGIAFKLSENWKIHTDINFQYGLKNIKRRNIDLLVPDEYAGVTATNYIGSIRPFSFGLRVGLEFSFDLFGADCECTSQHDD